MTWVIRVVSQKLHIFVFFSDFNKIILNCIGCLINAIEVLSTNNDCKGRIGLLFQMEWMIFKWWRIEYYLLLNLLRPWCIIVSFRNRVFTNKLFCSHCGNTLLLKEFLISTLYWLIFILNYWMVCTSFFVKVWLYRNWFGRLLIHHGLLSTFI